MSTSVDGEDSQCVTGDRGFLILDDASRQLEQLHNQSYKKRHIPVDDEEYRHREEENTISGLPAEPGEFTKKRKTYSSLDDPMSEFPEVQQLFSDEILCRACLGNWMTKQSCACCNKAVGDLAETPTPFFRCEEAHYIFWSSFRAEIEQGQQAWTGRYWKNTTLCELGHRGFRCKDSEATVRTLVVVRFCGCSVSNTANNLAQLLRNGWYPGTKTDPDSCSTFEVLEMFRLLNVGGNVNAHDFISVLERKTDVLEASGIRMGRLIELTGSVQGFHVNELPVVLFAMYLAGGVGSRSGWAEGYESGGNNCPLLAVSPPGT
ncbi:hypothetical protein DFH07DRAFT_764758 [Mycena maculata]|uniref:CxC2-like cysteine cluster KDZ transposase-associated domain-containing protein n=1 Tax=Mycena maculata TaxID=230809 RepID=A0AAD7KAF6_9AGAR|nr:hypothetical protein DFH07DRAFT_764758 [Mycena maculata]